MNPPRILIVEDDIDHGRSLAEAIGDLDCQVELAATGTAGVAAFRARGADVVLSDLVLPDMDGIEVMKQIRALDDGGTPVIVMTAYGSIDSSVRAMKEGAYDYLQKPLDVGDLQAKLFRALEASRLRRQVAVLSEEVRGKWTARAWVAESPAMREVVRQTLALAKTNATVLIRGRAEPARNSWRARCMRTVPGPRGRLWRSIAPPSRRACWRASCSAMKKAPSRVRWRAAPAHSSGLRAELCSWMKSAMPPAVQVKLLRVLEDREIVRVGGQESFKVDVRLVSATNRDLEAKLAAGAFRQDLLYRLQVVGISLPFLRERREDIRPLAERFMALAQSEHGRLVRAVEPEWYARLEAYAWPGNIRELRNAVEAAVVTAPTDVLEAARLRLDGPAMTPMAPTGGWSIPDGMKLEDIERKVLEEALRRNGGNRRLTAEQLGLSRRTIQRKIQDYHLPF